MTKDLFMLASQSKSFQNMERGVTLGRAEKIVLLDTISGELDGIVEGSLTESEQMLIKPLTRFGVKVWPKSNQHQADGGFEHNGLFVTVKHSSEKKFVKGKAIPLQKGEGPEKQRSEQTSETYLETNSQVACERTIAEARICATFTRMDSEVANFVTVTLPRTGHDTHDPIIRIYTDGPLRGEFHVVRGDLGRIVAALKEKFKLKISRDKVLKSDHEHVLDIAQKLRTLVFFPQ